MRRREFIELLIGAATLPFGWPMSVRAQSLRARVPRVGIIDDAPMWDAFRDELRKLGYREGRNIVLEYRTANGQPDRLVTAAAELARLPVNVIVTYGTPPTAAAKRATTKIPIVMIGIGNPLRAGFVESLARPGGNITGNTLLGPDMVAKRLQIFKEAIPTVSRVALLWNPNNASNVLNVDQIKVAAPALGMTYISVPIREAKEFDGALATMMKQRPDMVLVTADPLQQRNMDRIAQFLETERLPAMFQLKNNVLAGGLMSYGPTLPHLFRQAAGYVHKILRGARPADLPVEQPTKFELVVNLKTARALGLKIPESFLLRADQVID